MYAVMYIVFYALIAAVSTALTIATFPYIFLPMLVLYFIGMAVFKTSKNKTASTWAAIHLVLYTLTTASTATLIRSGAMNSYKNPYMCHISLIYSEICDKNMSVELATFYSIAYFMMAMPFFTASIAVTIEGALKSGDRDKVKFIHIFFALILSGIWIYFEVILMISGNRILGVAHTPRNLYNQSASDFLSCIAFCAILGILKYLLFYIIRIFKK